MADATFGWRSTQANANCGSDNPACWASGRTAWTASRTFGLSQSEFKNPFIDALAARLSAGTGVPGAYLPVSTPCPNGDQTICEMPDSAHSGMTAFSGSRCNNEYCGWLEMNFSTPGSAKAALILSTGHSENPM